LGAGVVLPVALMVSISGLSCGGGTSAAVADGGVSHAQGDASPADTAPTQVAADAAAAVGPGLGDAGPSDAAFSAGDGSPSSQACESLQDVSPSGANPFGDWSYGWATTATSPFMVYSNYDPSLQFLTHEAIQTGLGISAWSSSPLGSDFDPAAFDNRLSNEILAMGGAGNTVIPPGAFVLHPGPSGEYSIVRWTAPKTMVVGIDVTFTGLVQDGASTTTDVHVRQYASDLSGDGGYDLPGAAAVLNLDGSPNTAHFKSDVVFPVAAGDVFDFMVGNGGNGYDFDSTGIAVTLCAAATETAPPEATR
jgi:hypothetical protein